jgi:hypothetical protein
MAAKRNTCGQTAAENVGNYFCSGGRDTAAALQLLARGWEFKKCCYAARRFVDVLPSAGSARPIAMASVFGVAVREPRM